MNNRAKNKAKLRPIIKFKRMAMEKIMDTNKQKGRLPLILISIMGIIILILILILILMLILMEII